MTRAGLQSGLFGGGAMGFNQAQLGRANQADFANVGAQAAADLNKAQFQRQREQFDIGNLMQKYKWDQDQVANIASGLGAAGVNYDPPSFQPNFANPYAGLFQLGGNQNYSLGGGGAV